MFKALLVIATACFLVNGSANATGTHTTWTAVGERVTSSFMSKVFTTTPVNVPGFSTKASCDAAVGSMNNIPYPSTIGYNIKFQSMVVAECVEVTNEIYVAAP